MHEIRYYFMLLLLFCVSRAAQAQQVNNKTAFADGIYMNSSEFRRNAPQRSDRIFNKIRIETNKEQNIARISTNTAQYFEVEGLALHKAWGICVNKTPYIRIIDTLNYDKNDLVFAKLYVVGRVCYFYHRTESIESIIMNIYHPITQQKVGEKAVANRKKMMAQKIFNFQDDNIVDFNHNNLGERIKNDPQAYKTWEEMPQPIDQDQLFKLLLIYNERNPIEFEKNDKQ